MNKYFKYGLYKWSTRFQKWCLIRVGTKYKMYKSKKQFEEVFKQLKANTKFKVSIINKL